MDQIKKIDALVLRATGESVAQIPAELLRQILQIVNSRVDMPKHVIASISKRMALKNKRVIVNIFMLLEYLAYECELSLYAQISTKEFLLKISGFLMSKDVEPEVKAKIMQTVFCFEELFRPHQDLLPLFFQFYAGMLRSGFEIPHDYKSPFRPAQLRQYKKPEPVTGPTYKFQQSKSGSSKPKVEPTQLQQKTFEEIREKLILTNQIIDNSNPGGNVKENGLLLQMIEQIKECQKKVNKQSIPNDRTINDNPNERIMQLALAANDDIFITYRRFKDLQRQKKPQPFILTELASDIAKENEQRKVSQPSKVQQKPASGDSNKKIKAPQKPKQTTDIFDLLESQHEQKPAPKKQENILDMDYSPQPQLQPEPKKQAPKSSGDLFDLLSEPASQPAPTTTQLNFNPTQPSTFLPQGNLQPVFNPPNNGGLGDFNSLLLSSQNYQGLPAPSGFGITLNDNDFKTEADIKNYKNNSVVDKIDELTYEFLKK